MKHSPDSTQAGGGGRCKNKESKCQRIEKVMRTKLVMEARKSIACGKTLKPVHVRTRFPDLWRGSSQEKQRGGELEHDTQTFQPAYCTKASGELSIVSIGFTTEITDDSQSTRMLRFELAFVDYVQCETDIWRSFTRRFLSSYNNEPTHYTLCAPKDNGRG